jgi:hypothetical protein
MNYEGKLYGKVGKKYVELDSKTDDWDKLESDNRRLKDDIALIKSERDLKYEGDGYKIKELESEIDILKKEMEEFVEWVHKESWDLHGDAWSDFDIQNPKATIKTTSELYQMFKEWKTNNLK